MTDEELAELERVASPGAGACGGQFTANTMAMAFEVLGHQPDGLEHGPGRGRPQGRGRRSRPASSSSTSSSAACARATSSRRQSLENAIAAVATSGGSTNARAPPARASRARPASTSSIDDFDRISERTPLICDLKPGGRYVATDLYDAGGVPARRQAPAGGRPAPRGRDHRRPAARSASTPREADRDARARRSSARSTTRSRRPAAWRSCAATSRPTAAS